MQKVVPDYADDRDCESVVGMKTDVLMVQKRLAAARHQFSTTFTNLRDGNITFREARAGGRGIELPKSKFVGRCGVSRTTRSFLV